MKFMDWPKYSWCFPKESSVLSKRSDDAKRKQSIYSQISLNCYAGGGSNTGPKHRKIIDFPLGFREVFSLLPSCLCGLIWSNTIEIGGFGKNTCFSDVIKYPYEDFCKSLSHSCQGKGAFRYTPIATMYGQSHSRQSPLIFY